MLQIVSHEERIQEIIVLCSFGFIPLNIFSVKEKILLDMAESEWRKIYCYSITERMVPCR